MTHDEMRAARLRKAAQWAALYRDGQTLQQIGSAHGVTREYVRQLISLTGTTRLDGGKTISRFKAAHEFIAKRQAKQESREMLIRAKWGMTLDEYRAHVAEFGNSNQRGSPMQRYVQQRKNAARRRSIGWEFTFREWWAVWTESGHWSERGRGKGYVMARYGDSGPYRADNVYICTSGQNFSDAWLVDHPRRAKSRRLPVSATPYRVKGGQRWMVTVPTAPGPKKHFGRFNTREAAESYGLSLIGAAHG